MAQPLDHAPCAGDRASLYLPGASVRTERGVGEGSGGLYVDARARTRCMPAGNGEHSPQPPGDPGRAVAPQPVKSTEPLEPPQWLAEPAANLDLLADPLNP